MKLPFEPQPMGDMQARYLAAVKNVFDYRSSFPKVLPSQMRAHVFDFEDGMRMIVSRDRESDDETFLHVSASVEPGFGLYEKIVGRALGVDEFLRLVEERFVELSEDTLKLDFCGLSHGKGVPHWRRLEVS